MRDRLFAGTFLNFGKDYDGRNGYVYVYFTRIDNPPPTDRPRNWLHEVPGRVDLARVPKDRILSKSDYEWFSGMDGLANARWTRDMTGRVHAFEDPNGIKVVSVARAPGVNRYLLAYNPKDNRGNFGCSKCRSLGVRGGGGVPARLRAASHAAGREPARGHLPFSAEVVERGRAGVHARVQPRR